MCVVSECVVYVCVCVWCKSFVVFECVCVCVCQYQSGCGLASRMDQKVLSKELQRKRRLVILGKKECVCECVRRNIHSVLCVRLEIKWYLNPTHTLLYTHTHERGGRIRCAGVCCERVVSGWLVTMTTGGDSHWLHVY